MGKWGTFNFNIWPYLVPGNNSYHLRNLICFRVQRIFRNIFLRNVVGGVNGVEDGAGGNGNERDNDQISEGLDFRQKNDQHELDGVQ